jgi:alpha-maltose-1-phosphate synthase
LEGIINKSSSPYRFEGSDNLPALCSKVVVVSSLDVTSPAAWSGVPFSVTIAMQGLAKKLVIAAPLHPESTPEQDRKFLLHRSSGLRYLPNRDLSLLKLQAVHAGRILVSHSDADFVVSFHPPDVAFIETKVPIVIIHDATWRQYTSMYPGAKPNQLAAETYEDGLAAEALAFEKAQRVFFFTEWAVAAAKHEYPQHQGKFASMPPGSNVANSITPVSFSRHRGEHRVDAPMDLLFVGADAYRKGFDRALKAASILKKRSYDVRFHVIGIPREVEKRPVRFSSRIGGGDSNELNADVFSYGFLSQDRIEDDRLLRSLYSHAFLLLVPSRADCGSLAVCDAAAFGLPAIVSGVGGTGEYVVDEISGLNAGEKAEAEEYADLIEMLWHRRDKYLQMRVRARRLYETRFNWESHARNIAKLMQGAPAD